jgi:PKD repeat protein
MALTVNQNYQFSLGYAGAVNSINYLIDFGDGTSTGWFSGILNTATNVSHIFSMTGQFDITVSATSVVGMQVNIKEISNLLDLIRSHFFFFQANYVRNDSSSF